MEKMELVEDRDKLVEYLRVDFAKTRGSFMESYAYDLYRRCSLNFIELSNEEISKIMNIPADLAARYIKKAKYRAMVGDKYYGDSKKYGVVKVSVRFCFVSPLLDTLSRKDYNYLCEAVEVASHNLYSRYHVKISRPVIEEDEWGSYCVSELEIPDEIYDTFNIGRHLRGVSQYLLKTYPDHFERYTVGTRLLFYKKRRI